MEETLFGVLVDVSGSMQSAYALDTSNDASVERTHAILTTIMKIVKSEVERHCRQDSIFACAFGLDTRKCGPTCTGTCDLFSLFDCPKDPHQGLIDLAEKHGVREPEVETWIRKHLSRHEAQLLYMGLRHNPGLVQELKRLIKKEMNTPSIQVIAGSRRLETATKMMNVKVDAEVTKLEAYRLAHEIINSFWQQQLKPRRVQEVSEMLDAQLTARYIAWSTSSLHKRVLDLKPKAAACNLVSFDYPRDPHERLMDLAERNGVYMPELKRWCRNCLSQHKAQLLYVGLCHNQVLIHKLKQLIQEEMTLTRSMAMSALNWTPTKKVLELVNKTKEMDAMVDAKVTETKAYKFADEIISCQQQEQQEQQRQQQQQQERLWRQEQEQQRQWLRQQEKELERRVQEMLDAECYSAQSLSFLHGQIREFIEQIRPFIFGKTPMCKALRDASAVFRETDANRKVLFILSDGLSTDGDPRAIAQELRSLGVIIVTCFLTSHHIDNPRRLLYERDPSWSRDDGRRVLFEMSSTMKNTHTPISYLVDANWELSPSGESHLFVQANSLDVVDEFCETVVSQMTKRCDALVDIFEKVKLATYINQTNTEFKPKQQEGGTCYANAIAAVFHLSMHRIVGREGGIPSFYEIRKRIIDEYGIEGASTKIVLKNICKEYRLQFKEVDETGAREAINKRRPVIATFFLYEEQWTKFSAFYSKTRTPMGILKKCNVTGGSYANPGGHAVVLVECAPDHLTFMNSWGQDFADGGFFRVENQSVLNDTKFYDVYWIEDDLTQSEKEAFKREGTKRAENLLQKFPSIQDLSYKCPKCYRKSKVGEFVFHIVEAECPKCHQKFKPTNKEIMENLCTQTHKL